MRFEKWFSIMACHEQGAEQSEGPSRMAPVVGLVRIDFNITNSLQKKLW